MDCKELKLSLLTDKVIVYEKSEKDSNDNF